MIVREEGEKRRRSWERKRIKSRREGERGGKGRERWGEEGRERCKGTGRSRKKEIGKEERKKGGVRRTRKEERKGEEGRGISVRVGISGRVK